MKRLTTSLVVAVLLLLSAPAGAAELTIRRVDVSDFPEVSVIASVSSGQPIDPASLVIEENGATLDPVKVGSLTGSGQRLQVVLVIDTSGSMQGGAMRAAVAAASAFVKEMPEQVEVGVVSFSDQPRVLARPSADHRMAERAIRGLVATGETAMYDAVSVASTLFADEAQKNIVLLSDGGDTVSETALTGAVQAAKRRETAIFSVGLKGSEVDVSALKRLAAGTDGRYSPAATAELAHLYEQLATELKGQFVITYRSSAPNRSEVRLQVTSPVGSDSALFLAPREAVEEAPAPRLEEPADPVLQGAGGLALTLGLVFLSVMMGAYLVFGARIRNRRLSKLARLTGLRSSAAETSSPGSEVAAWIPVGLSRLGDKIAERKSVAQKIDSLLERSGGTLRPGEFIVIVMVATVAGGVLGVLLGGSGISMLVGAISGALVLVARTRFRVRKRVRRMQGLLPDVLGILAGSLRAGHSFFQALDGVAKEAPEPMNHEFSRVVAEIRLGRPVPEALESLADRIDSEDFRWALLAVNVQRDVGGNLAEILDTVAKTLRERADIRRQVRVLSSESRLSAYILSILPFGVGGYLYLLSPETTSQLFTTDMGRIMVAGAGVLLILGFVWMRKLVKIDV